MSRSYCFTLNNYTLEELGKLYNDSPKYRYIIIGAEKGEITETKHLQGYLELYKSQRISWFKEGSLSRAHFEKRQGPREIARDYCKKEGDYAEFGNWCAGGQGARTDLQKVMKAIKENTPIKQIMEDEPATVSRNLRFVEKYQQLVEKEQTKDFRKVDVEVLYGDAGVGKTRKAHEYDHDVFTVDSEASFPFDGYDGEKTILIDDFYGGIKYSQLLRILDGHQFRVNVKGGHRYARWTKIFITSNTEPDQWYKFGLTPALKRRITTVTRCCIEDPGNTMPDLLNEEKK